MSATLPGPFKDAPHQNAAIGSADFGAAVRSSVLELVSSARMLGKAEMLCELDSDADPSVRTEFEQRVRQARASLERLLTGNGDGESPTPAADLPTTPESAFALPSVDRQTPAPTQAASATDAIPSAAAAPVPGTAATKAQKAFTDWDEESRVGMGPIILLALAALGLMGWYLLQGTPGASGAFQYYQQRERCLAVSDALLDLRNGRAPRLNDSREQLLREEAMCNANGGPRL